MRISRRRLFLGTAAGAAAGREASAPRTPEEVGRRFTGEALREIAFPLGGIGTGTVSLGGYGNLRDWEIFNRPNKGGDLPFTFAALRISGGGLKRPCLRVLERRVLPPYGASHGIGRERAAGLPRFPEAVFFGGYPVANVFLQNSKLPVEVSLEAFNPMVPHDTATSSLPVAILTFGVRSRADAPLEAALAFSITNPIGWDGATRLSHRRAAFFGQNRNEYRRRGLHFSSSKYPPNSFRFGTMALVTNSQEVSYRCRWEHGAWWDELPAWWREFELGGRFPNNDSPPSDDGFTEYATLASHFALEPGQRHEVTFVIAWHFPNIEDYWTGQKPYYFEQKTDSARLIRNHYGAKWKDAWEPAVYTLENLERLRQATCEYRDALYSSSLPPEAIDAISSQSSTIRTNTVLVTEDKVPLAFEGCGDLEGCCPMNCTHVYNYEQALAHLYPELERTMRELDFLNNLREDGYMSFRTATPVQQGAYTRHPAADGQMGCILKLYREWQRSGDDAWLRRLWPAAKRALEFAWARWDTDRDGIMEAEQHNTYDIRFHGPNSMIGTLYLGALAAGAVMARRLGDTAAAQEYERVFQEGSARLDRLLWNGEYYIQKTDDSVTHQFGEGCLSDQLLGQWLAEILGLGKLLPAERIKSCLRAIYRYNFRESLDDLASGQRIYALNDEAGLLVCSWPKGKRPAVPFGYCDEVWTGVEYQVAAHLIYEDMVEEGLRIVRAVRDRHNGLRRNPWDESECGHHYARALSSWSLLTALSGFTYSAPEGSLGFSPKVARREFRCLFSTGTSWGTFHQRALRGTMEARIQVLGGELRLSSLVLSPPAKANRVECAAAAELRYEDGRAVVRFRERLAFPRGQQLAVILR